MKIVFFVFLFHKNKIVTNLDLINGGDGSLDFNGGHHFEGFLDGGRAHFFVAESDSSAQGLTKREKICKLKLFLPNSRRNRFGSRLKQKEIKGHSYLARSNKAGVQPDGQNGALVSKFGHDFMDILYIQDTLNAGIGILLACRGGETTLGLAHGFKGQLISECLLGVIDFPKKQQKN